MLNTPKTHPKNVSQSYCYDFTVYDFNLTNITDVQRGNYRHFENHLSLNRKQVLREYPGNKIQVRFLEIKSTKIKMSASALKEYLKCSMFESIDNIIISESQVWPLFTTYPTNVLITSSILV